MCDEISAAERVTLTDDFWDVGRDSEVDEVVVEKTWACVCPEYSAQVCVGPSEEQHDGSSPGDGVARRLKSIVQRGRKIDEVSSNSFAITGGGFRP